MPNKSLAYLDDAAELDIVVLELMSKWLCFAKLPIEYSLAASVPLLEAVSDDLNLDEATEADA
jgi:hypothetical protein